MVIALAKDPARTARWFHALADETRLRILERLADGEQCVCDLTTALESGQSRLSFHLRTLKDAGIVTDRRQGRWVYYSVNPDAIQEMNRVLAELSRGGAGPRARSARCQ